MALTAEERHDMRHMIRYLVTPPTGRFDVVTILEGLAGKTDDEIRAMIAKWQRNVARVAAVAAANEAMEQIDL